MTILGYTHTLANPTAHSGLEPKLKKKIKLTWFEILISSHLPCPPQNRLFFSPIRSFATFMSAYSAASTAAASPVDRGTYSPSTPHSRGFHTRESFHIQETQPPGRFDYSHGRGPAAPAEAHTARRENRLPSSAGWRAALAGLGERRDTLARGRQAGYGSLAGAAAGTGMAADAVAGP